LGLIGDDKDYDAAMIRANEKLGAPKGWVCPVCGKGLSPFTPSCDCTLKLTKDKQWKC